MGVCLSPNRAGGGQSVGAGAQGSPRRIQDRSTSDAEKVESDLSSRRNTSHSAQSPLSPVESQETGSRLMSFLQSPTNDAHGQSATQARVGLASQSATHALPHIASADPSGATLSSTANDAGASAAGTTANKRKKKKKRPEDGSRASQTTDMSAKIAALCRMNPVLRKSVVVLAMSTETYEIGDTLADDYLVEAHMDLGYIGCGHVVRNRNSELLVIKKVSFKNRENLKQVVYQRQTKLTVINHENIVRVCDLLESAVEETTLGIVTRYMEKGNITKYAGNLDDEPEKLRKILCDVGTGLRTLHTNRIEHCDIKLENVLELSNGSFALSDAGYGWLFISQELPCAVFTGELVYLPPEVFTDKRADPAYAVKADVWGFGLLMYTLAYGKPPYDIQNKTEEEMRAIYASATLTFPPKKWEFASTLNSAISACLNRDPSKRPSIHRLLRHEFFNKVARNGIFVGLSMSNLGFSTMNGMRHSMAAGNSMSNILEKRNGIVMNRSLGKGRHSETFEVHLRSSPGTKFALKIFIEPLMERLAADECYTRRSENMRRIAFSKKRVHPSIKPNIEYVDNKDGSFATQSIDNGSIHLLAYMNFLCTLSASLQPAEILAKILKGLVQMHGNGVYHLALNCENVFVTPSTGTVAVADYGPAFCTVKELLHGGPQGGMRYALPAHITRKLDPKRPESLQFVDTFTVALIAVSIEPSLRSTVWYQYSQEKGKTELFLPVIFQTFLTGSQEVSEAYTSFVKKALFTAATAKELLQHPLFAQLTTPDDFVVISVPISPSEEKCAVEEVFRHREESNLLRKLGYDMTQAETVLSYGISATAGGADGAGGRKSDASAADTHEQSAAPTPIKDGKLRLAKEPRCTVCSYGLRILLYHCTSCEDRLLCPKCNSSDRHNPRHVMEPVILSSIQNPDDPTSRVFIFSPPSMFDFTKLQGIEREANVPAGALTGYVSNTAAGGGRQPVNSSWSTAKEISLTLTSPSFSALVDVNSDGKNASGANRYSKAGSSSQTATKGTANESNSHSVQNKLPGVKPLKPSILKDSGTGENVQQGNVANRSGGSGAGLPGSDKSENNVHPLLKGKANSSLKRVGKGGLGGFGGGKGGLLSKGSPLNATTASNALRKFPKQWEVDVESNINEELELCADEKSPDLYLSAMHLPVVPQSIFKASVFHISFLDLTQNELVELPEEIGLFVNLRKLCLSENRIELLPESIGKMKDLEHLDVSHNRLRGLPSSCVQLYKLERIMADYNNFTEVPRCTLMMIPLQYLYLAENALITGLPPVAAMQEVASLTIGLDNEPNVWKSYERIKDSIPNVSIIWNKIYPDEIIPGLFCGSLRSAQTQRVYERLGIQYVLTVARELIPNPPENGVHKTINVDDLEGVNIKDAFEEAMEFIDEALKRKVGCLVHCFAGMSRSAATVIAYLMMRKGMRLDEAYVTTRRGRPAIYPNAGFFKQLVALDAELYPSKRPLNMESMEREKIPNA